MGAEDKAGELDLRDRAALLFREATDQKLATVLVFEGAGLGAIYGALTRLTQILDPRRFRCLNIKAAPLPTRRRPFLQEYWQELPAAGDLLILHGAYYHKLALWTMSSRPPSDQRLQSLCEEIQDFERSLAHNGVATIKIFCTPRGETVRSELKDLKLEGELKRELRRSWKKEMGDLARYQAALRPLLLAANTYEAPWYEPPGVNDRAVSYSILDYLVRRMEERLKIDSRQATADFDEAMRRMREFSRKLVAGEEG
ncbi:MAG: hypothetical protein K1X75_07275 [Leptospirales bacterium]|nr:hypothetical protein [Leptospirales bacterium]